MEINVKQKLKSRSNPMRTFINCVVILGLLVSASTSFAQETFNRTTYYHNTLQGAPVAATNEAGEVKWSQTYSSYGFHDGNSQAVEESTLVFGTAGHVEDQFDGRLLVYQKARYYDPALGRFLSIDPVGFQASNPQSFNRYAYVNNNPTTYVDPDGRLPFLIPVVIFLGKEIAAEMASRATNGATDFLSVRRLGTKAAKAAAKGVKSLRKKRKNPCGCFDADTPVLTADGHKPISEVELGELLVARDEFTGEIALKPVTELLRYEDRQFYELELTDEQGQSTLLDVTDDHPFWVENVGWVDSDDLEPGMLVRDLEGSWHGVKSMLPVERAGLAYNFEVGDFHTYFVGESDVWVHNCPDDVPNSAAKSLKEQAADLVPANVNKNRVTLRSQNQQLEIDLAGKAHNGVPTPHTKVSPRNHKAPENRQPAYNTSEKNSTVRPATQEDIRTVRRYLERQNR